ncbi:hypothetical protein OBBRIDRAFT_747179 [Obba rivulosa]|uniref:Pentatricopeptide repeat-containing protein n=1 Tax=Obba rivulosa TaxID=1052685 RepID=A0A8E2DRZ1_9APHY|nr:hypothetical protein OBBRIDRAFT_747179 [Obba rivulosa]
MVGSLLRYGSSQLASSITLDFLAPSLLLRRAAHSDASASKTNSSAKRASSNAQSQSAHILTSPPRRRTIRVQSPPTTARNLPNVISTLQSQLRKFHHQLSIDLSDAQADVYNRILSEVRAAVETRDLAKAWELWTTFKQKNLLRVFGPAQYDLYSRFVATMFRPAPKDRPFAPSDLKVLEELAMATAAAGASAGLQAYMIYLIKKSDTNGALQLFHRYLARMQEKHRAGLPAETSEDGEPEGRDIEASDELKQTASTHVHGDILLCAITAWAMRDEFLEAIQTTLQTTTRLSSFKVGPFLRQLPNDRALRDKVEMFVRRLELARLLARPTAFGLHLNNMANDRNEKIIQSFYESISEGVLGPQPWIAVQESAVSPQMPIYLSEATWSSFLTAFMRCRRTDLAGAVWNDMQKLGVTPGVLTWNALIDGYADLGDVEKALNSWNLMLSQGGRPDALTYRAVIRALFSSYRAVDAMRRFREFEKNLQELGPPEDAVLLVVYNTVLNGLLWSNQVQEARSLFRDMQARGPKPDIVSFNTFMKYYATKGELKELAAMLEAIEPAGLKGDVFTFSIVLSALLKVRNDAADVVIKLMRRQGLQPNTATLSAIIDNLMKAQTPESFKAALQLLSKMELNEFPDVVPNEVTYTSILASIHRSDWLDPQTAKEYTESIWNKMVLRYVQPSRVTYHVLLKACLDGESAGGTQEALKYFRDMVTRRVHVSGDTWYIILHRLMKRDELELALALLREMEDSGFEPGNALTDLIQRIRRRAWGRMKTGPKAYI